MNENIESINNYNGRKYIKISVVFLILISLIAYKEILGYYFIGRDTFPIIWAAKINSYEDILRIFSTPLGGGLTFWGAYRPISQLSFSIDYLIWGYNPFGYHLTDLLIHLLNTLLVFWFAIILLRNSKYRLSCAWLSALLFSLSPVNINLIPTINRRHDMVAGTFLILCLIAASKATIEKNNRRIWYILTTTFGAFAIFSKESAYVLPFLLGAYCFIFSIEIDYIKRLKHALKYFIPLIGVVFLNYIFHLHILGRLPKIPEGVFIHIKSGVSFLFWLIDPIELLRVDNRTKALILIMVLFGFTIPPLFAQIRHKKRRILNLLLSEGNKCYTFLFVFITLFCAIYMVTARAAPWYLYMPNIAFGILITKTVFHPFESLIEASIKRGLSTMVIVYIIIFSPLFIQYTAWSKSNEITQKHLNKIKTSITTHLIGKQNPTIYQVNLPTWLVDETSFKKEESSIFANYSMVAWAKMLESNDFPYVKFISLSCIIMSYSPNIKPNLEYHFKDNRIYVKTKNVEIIPAVNSGAKGDEPVIFNFNRKQGELTFNRNLKENEILLLYKGCDIEIVDCKKLSKYLPFN